MPNFQSLPKISWRKTIFLGFTSLLAFYIIFKTTVNINSILNDISHINLFYFWLAFATVLPSILLNTSRWFFILRSAGLSVSFKKIFMVATSSTALFVIPGRLGDLARSYPLRHEIPIEKTIATIVFEKIVDICVLLGYAGFGLIYYKYYLGSIIALGVAIFTIPIFLFLSRLRIRWIDRLKIGQKIYSALEILDNIKRGKINLAFAILCSVINIGLSLLAFYWLMLAVHTQVPLMAVLAFMPLCIFIGLIPLTLAGMGTRDAAIIHFFKLYALPSQSLSAGLLFAFQGYWVVALICLPFFIFYFRKDHRTTPHE